MLENSAPATAHDTITVPIDIHHPDPFGVPRRALSPAEQESGTVVAEIERGVDPLEPVRAIVRLAGGRLGLCDISGVEASLIGVPVTYAEAGELATQVLAGSSRARTAPVVVHTLALAFLAALAEAERRRQAAKQETNAAEAA